MNVAQMITLLENNVDDVVEPAVAVAWFNAGINKMAIEVGASFPQLQTTGALDDTPVFHEKYHEIPVTYAVAMYRGADGSRIEQQAIMGQFYEELANFTENYSPPEQYRDDDLTEQFTAAAGQTVFKITKDEYNARFGNLKVYVNSKKVSFSTENDTFTLTSPAAEGDAVTALWELHTTFEEPPYKWWTW